MSKVNRIHAILFVVLIGFVAAAGCTSKSCGFCDEFEGRPPVTTASVSAVRAAHTVPRTVVRPFEPTQRRAEDGTVTHVPLYFEDPYEVNGSNDGKFAWTAEDYWQIFYWRGRFLVNAVLFPVAIFVHPPWQATVSDGKLEPRCLGELHDAKRRENPESDQ